MTDAFKHLFTLDDPQGSFAMRVYISLRALSLSLSYPSRVARLRVPHRARFIAFLHVAERFFPACGELSTVSPVA